MIPMTKTVNPKAQEFRDLLKDPDMYNAFLDAVVTVLTDINGPQLVKRVKNIESHLGADDDWCVWEDVFKEDKKTLVPITKQFTNIQEQIVIPNAQDEEVKTLTLTEARALLLLERLENTAGTSKTKFLLAPDVAHFLKFEIREDLRISVKGNASKKALDVMIKLVDMRPDIVSMSKRRNGHQERYIQINASR